MKERKKKKTRNLNENVNLKKKMAGKNEKKNDIYI